MTDLMTTLVPLCHYRWMIPVLGELHRNGGCKFVTLRHRVGASADALRRTLDRLIELGLVMKNPGYGHPMRPEYIATARGNEIGKRSGYLYDALRELRVEHVCLQKWSLPVLVAATGDATRFTHIRHLLPGATARAVARTLRALTDENLLDRAVIDDYPPSVVYEVSRAGRRPARLALAVAHGFVPRSL